ncbi:hypothetical protein BpHYR1_011629 [Brachionus plicatilis]|uniref:Uncharacterized protein n=1 Tax=Brachionus plicatilis TaxID=10195 RepID=A0A3M7SRE4_BRAPC|nr:hypothetical protein BpHYR1_011629 [Brachionus plicatilis]
MILDQTPKRLAYLFIDKRNSPIFQIIYIKSCCSYKSFRSLTSLLNRGLETSKYQMSYSEINFERLMQPRLQLKKLFKINLLNIRGKVELQEKLEIKNMGDSNRLQLNPHSISSDFEQAFLSAVNNTYDDTVSYECFFDYKQNLRRKVQEFGYQTAYNEISEVRLFFKNIAALAFVPVDDVIYVKRGRGIGLKDSTFKHDPWNVYVRNIEKMLRTNNNIEGWHSALQNFIRRSTVICAFIDKIKLEQAKMEAIHLQLVT